MKKILYLSSLSLIFIIASVMAAENTISLPANKQQQQPSAVTISPSLNNAPSITPITPTEPNMNAKAYILMDANSGAILAGKNVDVRLSPASLTKLMTVYVASQALRQGQIHLEDPVNISEKAWRMGGSRMFLKLGSTVSVKDLIDGIVVASGNDSCVALAEHLAGSEESFADLMNRFAQQLGMKNTHFMDSTGLPNPEHYSTAYDLATLTRDLIMNYPEDYSWYKQKWIIHNNIRQPNRNRLLWRDSTVDGLKTGHTDDAGFCLVASAKRGDMRLISVVLGEPNDNIRTTDSQELLNWGFRFFQSQKIFPKEKPVANVKIWFGKQNNVSMGLMHDLYVTLTANQKPNLKANLQMPTKLKAPIVKGQSYGVIQLMDGDKVLTSAPVVALENNPKAGFFSRIMDHISMLLTGWFRSGSELLIKK